MYHNPSPRQKLRPDRDRPTADDRIALLRLERDWAQNRLARVPRFLCNTGPTARSEMSPADKVRFVQAPFCDTEGPSYGARAAIAVAVLALFVAGGLALYALLRGAS